MNTPLMTRGGAFPEQTARLPCKKVLRGKMPEFRDTFDSGGAGDRLAFVEGKSRPGF